MDLVDNLLERSLSNSAAGPDASVQNELTSILRGLVEDSQDIIGSLLTSNDGHAWAQVLPAGFDAKRFSAMSSALMALSGTLAKEAEKGPTRNVLIEGEGGNIYLLHAGKVLTLTVFTGTNPNLGLTLAHARRAVENIAAVTEKSSTINK